MDDGTEDGTQGEVQGELRGALFDAGILSGGEARPAPWQRYISQIDTAKTNAGGEAMPRRVRRAS